MISGTRWKWILGLAAGALVVAVWALAPLGSWLESLNAWLERLGPTGWVVFAGVYVLATVALLPASALTLAAGLAFGLWAFPLVVVSASLGASAAFLVGRHLAREAVSRRFAHHPRFKAVDRAVGIEGWKIVGLMRLSPLVPFNLQNYLFGLTEVRFWHYVWATFFGIMPGTLMYVYFGAAGRAALDEAATTDGSKPLRLVLLAAGLLATIAVTVLVTRTARRQLAEIAGPSDQAP